MLDWVLLSHFLVVLGFLLCAVIVAQILADQRRHPRAVAWLLLIVLLPYAGVPLYLFFGGRKIRQLVDSKTGLHLIGDRSIPLAQADPIDRLLRSYKIPGAARGNRVRICRDGVSSYKALVEVIDSAEESIQVVTYLLRNDPVGRAIVEQLVDKARSGVAVELLLDGIGSLLLNRKTLAPLKGAGASVQMFIPVLQSPLRGRANLRNHRKMVIVDSCRVWSGGANIGSEYIGPTESTERWIDLTFTLEGPTVRQFSEVFQSDWEFAKGTPTTARPRPVAPAEKETDGACAQLVPSGPDMTGEPLHSALLTAAFTSTERLWIVTPYFVPDDPLLEAFCIAARRGIDVRVLVPGSSNHYIADIARGPALRELQSAGGRALLLDRMVHAKAVIVDRKLAVIGSANVDARSLFLNFECSTFFYSQREIEETAEWYEQLARKARLGVPSAQRPVKLLEGTVRLISPLL